MASLRLGGFLLCAAAAAAMPSPAAAGLLRQAKEFVEDRMPDVSWSVSPETVRAREPIRVEVRPFSQGQWTCRVYFLMRKEKSSPFPCGSKAAAISLPAPDLVRPGTVTVSLGFCSPPGWAKASKYVCWGKERKVRVVPAARGSRDADPVVEPDAAPAPVPLGRAPAGSFRAEAPEGGGGEVPTAPEIAPSVPPVRSGSQRVRGLDGKTYETAGAPASFSGRNRAYRAALLEDELIRQGYADWSRLTRDERLEVLRRAAKLHAAVFGTPAASVGLRGLEPKRLGVYTGDQIWLDPDKRAFQDPNEALGLLTHEATHHYQRELVGKLRAGKLQPGSEEHRLAEAWAADLERYCCEVCEKHCDYAAYREQSVERSAFEAGEAASLHLRRQRRAGGGDVF